MYVCILLCSLTGSLMAQDIITTKEGKDIQAKVLEISKTEIKYLDFENQEGPTYVLDKADILLIRYQNGKNEVFNNDSSNHDATKKPVTTVYVTDGMRYKEYKHLYNYHNYNRQFDDQYNPTLAGVASFLIPGLGQGVCDEWGRGLAVFGGYVAGSVLWVMSIAIPSLTNGNYSHGVWYPNPSSIVIGAFALTVYNIWNIVDAVHVAKIKNMYIRDIHGRQANVSFGISPYMTYLNTPEASSPAFGLSFGINF